MVKSIMNFLRNSKVAATIDAVIFSTLLGGSTVVGQEMSKPAEQKQEISRSIEDTLIKARNLEKAGDYEKALKAYKTVDATWLYGTDPKVSMGRIYLKLGEYDKAINELDSAITLIENPDIIYMEKGAYLLRGLASCEKGEYDKGIENFHKGLILHQHEPEYYITIGEAWQKKRNNEKAKECFDAAKDLAIGLSIVRNSRRAKYFKKSRKYYEENSIRSVQR